MQCPYCQHLNSRVLESRSTEGGKAIRRRRECLRCEHRFTTYERIEFVPISVIKKDGKKEGFDRSKILRGMVRACEKTEITYQTLEDIVDDIEAQLQQPAGKEITSSEIGKVVLNYLRNISQVAYIRFASVYGQFEGVEDFVAALEELQNQDAEGFEIAPQWSCPLPEQESPSAAEIVSYPT